MSGLIFLLIWTISLGGLYFFLNRRYERKMHFYIQSVENLEKGEILPHQKPGHIPGKEENIVQKLFITWRKTFRVIQANTSALDAITVALKGITEKLKEGT